jgi:two-component system chemotaxis sensor kinase CheA
MRARLVPIRDTFSRMQFIVRDLTREFEKEAQVQLIGGETEVDKFIVERAMDPLLHLVRNAVSHGIEPAGQRVAAGKSAAGSIALRARTNGQTIIIDVEDDGRGINREEVFARAQRLGLLPVGGGLDDTDILEILCEPGFSTRDDVDRASGRGVGMNVVKSTVEGLGGRLSLATESGKGTRFSMQLPLTLSIADALIFEVGGQTFALPQASVQEVFEFNSEETSNLEHQEIVVHRGGALPLVRLSALFGLSARPRPTLFAVTIGEARGAVGLVVDRLIGLHEIVARPMTDPLVRVMGIAGVTELGDGRVVLILDALGAIHAAAERKSADTKAAAAAMAAQLGACHGAR